MSPRAPALPPGERRATIVTAALGILQAKGQAATTREIAEAAGVAEGTLFRVFRTKEDLLCAAMEHAFDPSPLLADLGRVDAGLPLRERLVAAAGIIQTRHLQVFGLMQAMGIVHPPDHPPRRSGGAPDGGRESERASWRRQVEERLAALIEPDADQLRVPVDQLVALIALLGFAGSHPILTGGQTLSPETIVEVLLDGTRKRD